jgi:pimeloyl-ACP methyl ester carboxylesterase
LAPGLNDSPAGLAAWIVEKFRAWSDCGGDVESRFTKDELLTHALFPKDISQPPREWAQRFFNVQRWTEMPRGGHFAALEEPEKLAEDIRAWFRQFREYPTTPEESLEARTLVLELQGNS